MDSDLEKSYIFGAIFILANRLQILGDKFDENLTTKQWLMLIGIFHRNTESPTISEVANFIGNSRQNVKKMAVILDRKGFVKLEKDTNDARILRIRFTKKCQKYFIAREKREQEFLQRLYEGFDADLIKGLYNGIKQLEKNIVKMENIYE